MFIEENKALVRRFVEEFWNQGNTATAEELMAPDAEIHMPTGETLDLDGLKGSSVAFRASFPDWHSTFEELVAEATGWQSGGPAGAHTGVSSGASLPPASVSRGLAASSTASQAARSCSSRASST